MPVVRLCAVSCLLCLIVAVSLSGQQSPASTAGAQQAAAPKVTGNLEHGRYLVEQVVMCSECHSARDPQGNIMAGHEVQGRPDARSSDVERRLANSDPADCRTSGIHRRTGHAAADSGCDQVGWQATASADATVQDVSAGCRRRHCVFEISIGSGLLGSGALGRCFRRRDGHIHPRRAAHDSQRGGDVDRLAREHAMKVVDARDRGR